MADHESVDRRQAWTAWINQQLTQREWSPADLIAASGHRLTSTQISRWRAGKTGPDIDGLRAVADGLGVPVLRVLIAAQFVTAEEAEVSVITEQRPLSDYPVRDLLDHLADRYSVEHPVDSASDVPDGVYRWPTSSAPSARKLDDAPKKTNDRLEQ